MLYNGLVEQITRDLSELCVAIGDRHPGSERNRQATKYVHRRFVENGLAVQSPRFECLDWVCGGVALQVGNETLTAFAGPYNESFQFAGTFQTAATLAELEHLSLTAPILVLHGELCREQLAAKYFVFYNPEEHQKIIALLEQKAPRAVIAITGCNPSTTGALNPFPLIEDADFLIPSLYLSEAEGARILDQPGAEIRLSMDCQRIPGPAYNIIATKSGQSPERIVFCAHVDTKPGTPGAIDNAGGVCLLMSLAGLLRDYHGKHTIELLIINGEDYYSYPGGMHYLADHQGDLEQIRLLVNSDGAGSRGSRTTYCHFNAGEPLIQTLNQTFRERNLFLPVDPWYQSDHAMFALQGVPAVALTTEAFPEIWAHVAHTARDTVDGVDPGILASLALSLRGLIDTLDQSL